MPEINCPFCHEENEIEHEDLPERSADDMEYQCQFCDAELRIGWYAELEII